MEATQLKKAASSSPADEVASDGRLAGPAIEVEDLAKTYPGDVQAVRGISFDVSPGEVFGLLGPNGAGKSTTVGMLTTTIGPSGGNARLVGYDVATNPRAARAVSSVVFQEATVDRALNWKRRRARVITGPSGFCVAAASGRAISVVAAVIVSFPSFISRPSRRAGRRSGADTHRRASARAC
jgi:ABC-type glutathione transport system ATPase component